MHDAPQKANARDAAAALPAEIAWSEDGAPINQRFGDIYFSREDGAAETDYVFLAGCGLPGAFAGRRRFRTAELGFGLGLTTARLLAAWRAAPDRPELLATSFEIAPAPIEDMARALAPWPDATRLVERLAPAWPPTPGRNRYSLAEAAEGAATLELIVGDANETVPDWDGRADAWFLDGHSPAKNPELWTEPLLEAVYAHTDDGGVFATYAAAGFVRRGLAAAGFSVERRPGYGRKREMLTGRKPAKT